MTGKLLFRTFSFYRTIKSVLFRLLFLAAGIFAILHYEENPLVTSIVFAFGILVFLTGGDDQIAIYEDRLKIRGGTWRQRFRSLKGYRYIDIEKLVLAGTVGLKQDAGRDMIVSIPGPGFPSRNENEVSVFIKDGQCIKYRMSIYRDEIDAALAKIPAPFDALLANG